MHKEEQKDGTVSMNSCTEQNNRIGSNNIEPDEIWDSDFIDNLIDHSYFHGASVFEYCEGNVKIKKVNKKYIKLMTGDNPTANREWTYDWTKYISKDALEESLSFMREAIAEGTEVSHEMEVRGLKDTSKAIFIRANMCVVASKDNRYLFYCIIEDLTAQREAESRERTSMEQLKMILSGVGSGVTAEISGEETQEFMYANDQYYSMFGYTREQYDYEVKDKRDLIFPKDLERVENEHRRILESKEPITIDFRIFCRDRSVKWIRLFGSKTVIEETGQTILLSVFRDISADIEEDDRRKDLIENLPCGAGIFEYNKYAVTKLRVIYLNSIFWGLIGRKPDDDYKSSPMDYIQMQDKAYFLKLLQEAVLHNGRLQGEIHIKHGNGKYVPFVLNGNVVKERSSIVTVYVTYTPITEDIATFREMLPTALQTMMSTSNDLSFIKDRSLHYVCASKAFIKMIGLKDGNQLTGKTDYDIFDASFAMKYRSDDLLVMKKGTSLVDYIQEMPSVNGRRRYANTSKYLLKDSHGNVVGIYGIGRDVTDSKEALERLRLLTNSIPGGLLKLEITQEYIHMLYVTDGASKIIGYSSIDNTGDQIDLLDYIVLADRGEMRQQANRMIEKSEPIDCYFRVKPKDEKCRWINIKGNLADRVGVIATVNAVVLDVTDQKLAEIKRNQLDSENRIKYEHELQLRNELVRDSIFYYQVNLTTGIVEEYQSKMGDVNGLAKNVLLNDRIVYNILQRIKQEDREKVKSTVLFDSLLDAYERGETSAQCIYRRKVYDNEYRFVKLEASIMKKPDNSDVVAFLHCSDINTDHIGRLAIETILNEDIEIVIQLNIKNGVADIAHMKEDIKYYQQNSSFDFDITHKAYCEEFVVKEDMKMFMEVFSVKGLKKALKREKTVTTYFRIKQVDGIHRKMTNAYYLDDEQSIVVITRRDITRDFEEEQKQKELLRRAVEDANKANNAKSDFLSHMSHDIRTPLNAVLSFSKREMTDRADEKKLREYLDKINISGEYLLGIVNDVLDISRIEQNRIVLKPEPYSKESFVKTIRNVIDELSREKDITFILNDERDMTTCITVDRVRFNQIIINLLSNAVKFTKRGGTVELIIEDNPQPEGNGIIKRLIVKDNGIGMSEDFIPHAFESFNQEYRKDVSDRNQGTGLGLTIVKKLVEIMNGTIKVESKINVGTTFTVELPFDTLEAMGKMAEVEKTDIEKLNGARILLAEDNAINTEIAITLLERCGCVLDCVEDGESACWRFESSDDGYYQIILMDIRMPIMDGLTATRRIRAMDKADARTIPIIAMTADAFREDEQTAYDAGMNEYVAKPIEPRILYEKCCKCLK